MKIRIIAAVATVLLIVTGLVLVANYTKQADARALAGQEMREVYLVTEPVAQGTAAEDLDEFVKLQKVPAATVPGDSIASLEEQSGKVAAVNLQPGEQLLSSRLVDPQVLAAPGTVPVPKGFQEVTFTLGPAQVVGGRVKAGDTVGVYVALEEDKDGKALVTKKLHQVLITSVQGAPAGTTSDSKEDAEGEDNAAPPVPEGSMLVTMALNGAEAEEMIFASSFANIWLSAEDKDAVKNNDGARIEDF